MAISFHGVLAPNARMRAQVVPQGPDEGAEGAQPVAFDRPSAKGRGEAF